ncbi:MAG: metallophosphoesterase, partial [Bacteroidetes bacterium]|nr:metallophosphoesterase [Bacteroidota bacterium]
MPEHMPQIMALPDKHFAVISRTALAHVVLAAIIGSLSALPCQAQEEYPRPADDQRAYQLFLLGNTGSPSPDDLRPTLELLKRQLATAGQQSAVVFLGDQLYDGGMPEVGAPGRAEAEGQLVPLIEAVRGYEGKVFFLPGDKDYGAGADRLAALRRQETFIEEHLDRGNVFRPNKGAPGPDDVKLNDNLRLVVLDTDWLLHEGLHPTRDDDRETINVYAELEDVLRNRRSDDLVVVGHHPIHSNGRYGGHRAPYYLLPGLGTLLYAGKRDRGNEQYFSHEQNEWMRLTLESLLTVHQDFIYVAAHDYSLQHFDDEKTNKVRNFLVSGSAARSEFVAPRHAAANYDVKLATNEKGYLSLHFYADGSIWIEAWGVEDGGRRLHEAMLRRPELASETPAVASSSQTSPDYADSTITIIPGPGYKAGIFRKFFVGSNYRKVWATEIDVP